jgi:hypothetical protein
VCGIFCEYVSCECISMDGGRSLVVRTIVSTSVTGCRRAKLLSRKFSRLTLRAESRSMLPIHAPIAVLMRSIFISSNQRNRSVVHADVGEEIFPVDL